MAMPQAPAQPVRDESITLEQGFLLAEKLDEHGFPREDAHGRTLTLALRLAMAVGLAGSYKRHMERSDV